MFWVKRNLINEKYNDNNLFKIKIFIQIQIFFNIFDFPTVYELIDKKPIS